MHKREFTCTRYSYHTQAVDEYKQVKHNCYISFRISKCVPAVGAPVLVPAPPGRTVGLVGLAVGLTVGLAVARLAVGLTVAGTVVS
jgi:hypothetical protein